MGGRLTIIGCGPGAADLMTIRGKRALDNGEVIVGSRRLLNDFTSESRTATLLLENNYNEILDDVERLRRDKRVVFLVSGDPLLHSFGESIIKRFGIDACEVIPGISSFQYAFSLLKEGWKGYGIFSLHGVDEPEVTGIFERNDRFILLLDPKHNLGYIKRQIKAADGYRYKFYVASNLSLSTEKLSEVSYNNLDTIQEESLTILIVRRDDE